jgi:hypothetical protein
MNLDGRPEPPDDIAEAERLAQHLASRHADGMALQRSLAENRDVHQHEHDGPGTIRNHDRDDLAYDDQAVRQILAELAEGEPSPRRTARSQSVRAVTSSLLSPVPA